jgi:hypothetical protein
MKESEIDWEEMDKLIFANKVIQAVRMYATRYRMFYEGGFIKESLMAIDSRKAYLLAHYPERFEAEQDTKDISDEETNENR